MGVFLSGHPRGRHRVGGPGCPGTGCLGPTATVSWSVGWGKGLLLVAKNFSVNPVELDHLLQQAAWGDLQLPDFQRGWVWDDKAIVSLLASISLSFPIGAVMVLATGNPDVRFAPRLLEGVKLNSSKEPGLLLLDGQQRLTSLFSLFDRPMLWLPVTLGAER